jgi:hypothetical protein
VDFRPVLERLNQQLTSDSALSADVAPPEGDDMEFVGGHSPKPVYVQAHQGITINMDSLPHLVDQVAVNKAAVNVCGGGHCPTKPSSAPASKADLGTGSLFATPPS